MTSNCYHRRDRHGNPVPQHILPQGLERDDPQVDNTCPRQPWAEDLDDLARDSFDWQETFLNGWEKVTTNGYTGLTESPDKEAELKIWNGGE